MSETAFNLEEFLKETGVRMVEITDEFDYEQSRLSQMKNGRSDIPEDFIERLLPWAAQKTKGRAEYAQAALERFCTLTSVR